MTLNIELTRVGHRRGPASFIPIEARVLQGAKRGDNILVGVSMTDVESVKEAVQTKVNNMFRNAVKIEWVDRTNE